MIFNKIIPAFLIVLFSLLAISFHTSKVHKKEMKMRVEVQNVYKTLHSYYALFDCISGYDEYMAYLQRSIDWLGDSVHFGFQFNRFKEQFLTSAQVTYRSFLVSVIQLYPQPYIQINKEYFGILEEVKYIYDEYDEVTKDDAT